MSKRRLSDQQKSRIAGKQQKEFCATENTGSIQEAKFNGRVISHFGQQLDVEILTGKNAGSLMRCYQRANLPSLVTGDLVLWKEDAEETGIIIAQAERKNVFGRADIKGQFKPVAANLDYVLIVFAVVPEAFLNLMDRYLVAISQLGLEPLLVLNKVDLLEDLTNENIDNILSIYHNLGYPVYEVSALAGTGLEALENQLSGKTTVLVGQSGVGKSSLINKLGFDQLAEVGNLSDSKYKGTHTTTTSRLFHLRRFDLIDSPGIREFSLGQMEIDEVLNGFIELKEHSSKCKFRDCGHSSEPGCAIQAAIANGEIHRERFESYQRILVSMQ